MNFVLRWQLVGMTDFIIYQLCDLGQANILKLICIFSENVIDNCITDIGH